MQGEKALHRMGHYGALGTLMWGGTRRKDSDDKALKGCLVVHLRKDAQGTCCCWDVTGPAHGCTCPVTAVCSGALHCGRCLTSNSRCGEIRVCRPSSQTPPAPEFQPHPPGATVRTLQQLNNWSGSQVGRWTKGCLADRESRQPAELAQPQGSPAVQAPEPAGVSCLVAHLVKYLAP